MNDHLTRIAGVEHLRDWLAEHEHAPCPTREVEQPCLKCGTPLTVRASRHRAATIVYHPSVTCEDRERFWHYPDMDRAEALAAHAEVTK